MPEPGPPGDAGRGGPPWRHREGFRPPWWPDGEPFPPRGPGPWARPFRRRIGAAFAFLFLLLFLTSGLAVAVLSGVFGLPRHRGLVPLAAILGLLLLIGFVALARSLRRVAGPLSDVMQAADRVAGGDYGARVAERGPREMRRLARSFNAMTERLSSAEERRRALLADVAHELRTPLAVIQGNAEGMLDGLYPADREHLQPLVDTSRVMARLLDDLQTLSTVEAGVLRLHREPTAPAGLVGDAVAAFRSLADERGVRLEGRPDGGLALLEVDPTRIAEVLSNLVANALRHTPSGGSVEVAAGPSDGGRAVAFTVSDTGEGIPAERLPFVFDRYVKSADSGGAGLGLAIAKSLVEAHGGTIAAESEPGAGTTVRFTLPARSG